MTTVDASDAFRRAAYGLFGLAALNLLGGMVLLYLVDDAHEVGLIGSLAFLEALIKLALAVAVWRGSQVAAITAMVVLGISALLEVANLVGGRVDALLRLVLVGLVIWWLRRALVAARRARPPAADGSRSAAGG